ncbi:DUF3750 domain-containing protein [Halobacteriovorax sp. HLS]|uniref:DUF3750 domain-containing protein n=1 Tax=Halobacteriovorax sp. HLS TaxID=2234000 RepID=UPI000FD8B2C3|nr:DUF3750 domain-containing protein [Halobacteriovorax sp. HLS]
MINKYLALLLCLLLFSCSSKSWREASRQSVGIAPLAADLKEDIVLIYYARAFSWRGNFGIHPWVAWKKKEDSQYTVAQVTSWNLRREGTTVSVKRDLPDRKWYDNDPTQLFEARGQKASKIIKKLKALIKDYPYKDNYTLWPGPNSNTFVSHLIRNIDELDIELPAHGIGKDYFGKTKFISNTASNTGFTLSLFGALGLTLGAAEGVEINLLGLHFGVDFWTPALKLPFFGRVGFKDKAF